MIWVFLPEIAFAGFCVFILVCKVLFVHARSECECIKSCFFLLAVLEPQFWIPAYSLENPLFLQVFPADSASRVMLRMPYRFRKLLFCGKCGGCIVCMADENTCYIKTKTRRFGFARIGVAVLLNSVPKDFYKTRHSLCVRCQRRSAQRSLDTCSDFCAKRKGKNDAYWMLRPCFFGFGRKNLVF